MPIEGRGSAFCIFADDMAGKDRRVLAEDCQKEALFFQVLLRDLRTDGAVLVLPLARFGKRASD